MEFVLGIKELIFDVGFDPENAGEMEFCDKVIEWINKSEDMRAQSAFDIQSGKRLLKVSYKYFN